MREAAGQSPSSISVLVRLMEQYQESVYRFLRGSVSDAEQAHDLLQDVFCDAWRAIRRQAPPFDGAGTASGVRQWLFHVAYCRAISARRHGNLIVWDSLDTDSIGDDSHLMLPAYEDQLVEGEAVRAAMRRLAPDEATCLVLNVIHGFTAAEIARIVGISGDAAKKRLSRAKQHLRDVYAHESRTLEGAH